MASSVTPFLMFEQAAEQALHFYVSLFPDARIDRLEKYAAGEGGPEGSIKRAELTIAGQRLRFFDSPVKHGFTFTPSISLFIECESETEFESLFGQLSSGGMVMMEPANYGFSTRFAWLNDRFGVSWQLNWGAPTDVS